MRRFVQAIYDHTVPGGVWINSDVCGPDGRDRCRVLLATACPHPRPACACRDAGVVAALSTRARLDQFAADFAFPFAVRGRWATTPCGCRLGDAMDYLTRKDYTDNWLSETQEQFCGLEFADWKALLADVGFEVDPASRAYRNDWIVENRLAPVAALSTLDGRPLDWPVTHILLVARRPFNT